MMDEKRFYWIKLKSSMLTSKTIDFLMSQKNGANYVVLYQMLCLLTINSNGELVDYIGECVIPFDENKIQRETKYFNIDTIRVALELYKRLGLVYIQENGMLKIANFEELIGSESKSAEKVRKWREEKAKRLHCNQNVTEMLPDCNQECNQNVRQEYRDKSIEYRDKSIDSSSNINITPPEQLNSGEKEDSQKRFSKPTIEEVRAYCLERKNNVDPEQFVDFYSAKGWKVGNSPMKDWKACVRTWEKRNPNPPIKNNYSWNNNNSKKNPPLDENGNVDLTCGGTFRGTIL